MRGPEWTYLFGLLDQMPAETLALLFGAAVLFALALLWVVLRITRRSAAPSAKAPAPQKPIVIIDGSNVMYWDEGVPKMETVRKAVLSLHAQGYKVGVMFDANAGHILAGKYLHDDAMADALGLPQSDIMVVPKGTPADPYLLKAAREHKAQILTNDKFRDWAADYPEVRRPGHLIKGRCAGGALELKLGPAPKTSQ